MEKGKENANRQKNMLDTVKINHVQHISFTQSRLTDAVSVILSELLSYEHPSKGLGLFVCIKPLFCAASCQRFFVQVSSILTDFEHKYIDKYLCDEYHIDINRCNRRAK